MITPTVVKTAGPGGPRGVPGAPLLAASLPDGNHASTASRPLDGRKAAGIARFSRHGLGDGRSRIGDDLPLPI